ncbi:MAG TPA: arabinan endo-1,5-alpha-L-arabinosidase [Candidatus Nitrosopolaris sp.]|nr:arabinan endo-1,5-alpha-L-arabinosidase [Candidatus Nitrosopolaris sp.]
MQKRYRFDDENFQLQWPRTMTCSNALACPVGMEFFFSHFQRTLVVFSALWFGFPFPNQTAAAQTQAVVSATSPGPATEPVIFGGRQVRAHDPSAIVKCQDEYWIFYTGRGIPSYRSKDLVKWEAGPAVFTNAPDWIAQAVPANRWMNYWAPDVIHWRDQYLLYYAVSTFGKNQSAIGLATNPTLDPAAPRFHWADQGIVVQSTNTDNFNAIDPAVSQDADGNLWLAFGSFWSGIKMIQLDPNTGKRIATNSPMYSLAFNDSIEASYIHHYGKFYYLFVNWGRCCRGTNSTYEIRVGRSRKITGPYLDQAGTDLMTGGGSPFLKTTGPFIGPGQVGIFSEGGTDWLSCHFYDGTESGRPTLAILPLRWNTSGWPEIVMPPKQQ